MNRCGLWLITGYWFLMPYQLHRSCQGEAFCKLENNSDSIEWHSLFIITENHRLDSSYENHLVMKLILVSCTSGIDRVNSLILLEVSVLRSSPPPTVSLIWSQSVAMEMFVIVYVCLSSVVFLCVQYIKCCISASKCAWVSDLLMPRFLFNVSL